MQAWIEKLRQHPRRLFFVDAVGAFLTAFFLFAILRPFHEHIGMPPMVLAWLAAIALGFFIYSSTCCLLCNRRFRLFIRIIAIANLLYCAATFGLVLFYFPQMTVLGIGYFLIEIVLVLMLVYMEFKV